MSINHADLVGDAIPATLLANLNSELTTTRIIEMKVSVRYEEIIHISLMGRVEGHEWSEFLLILSGEPESILSSSIKITPDFHRIIPWRRDRKKIEEFFRKDVAPKYCSF